MFTREFIFKDLEGFSTVVVVVVVVVVVSLVYLGQTLPLRIVIDPIVSAMPVM